MTTNKEYEKIGRNTEKIVVLIFYISLVAAFVLVGYLIAKEECIQFIGQVETLTIAKEYCKQMLGV